MKDHYPSIAEVRTAIEVLAKLDERINLETAHSLSQFPSTRLGVYHAKNLEGRALTQILRIQNVCLQLESWCEVLGAERKTCAGPSQQTKRPRFFVPTKYLWSLVKHLTSASISPRSNEIGKMVPKNQL